MPSADAIERATGRPWAFWLARLDQYGGELNHTQRARRLQQEHADLSGWWVQSLTVEYERQRGLREVGQAGTGDFQVSCSKTLSLPGHQAWQRLLDVLGGQWEEGATWQSPEGDVEVRRVDPPEALRWFLHDDQGKSTVEVTLQDKGDRSTVVFRHIGLSDADGREHYRTRWKAVLARLP